MSPGPSCQSVCVSLSVSWTVEKQMIVSGYHWGGEWGGPGIGVLDGGAHLLRGRGSFGGFLDRFGVLSIGFNRFFEFILCMWVHKLCITATLLHKRCLVSCAVFAQFSYI